MLINEERLWGVGIVVILLLMWLVTYAINQYNYKKKDYDYVIEDDMKKRKGK